jgi:hypothetical protein
VCIPPQKVGFPLPNVGGAALTGALAAGLAAAPAAQAAISAPAAQAATADSSSAVQAQTAPRRHFIGPYFSDSREDRRHESYFRGYWYKKSGGYYFTGDLFDRHRDRDGSYVWFKWYDRFGKFHKQSYRTDGRRHFAPIRFKRDFDVRVCEGRSSSSGCGGWHDVF